MKDKPIIQEMAEISKSERIIIAAAAVTFGSIMTCGGIVGPVIGAAAVDYAVQKLGKGRKAKS